MAVDLADPSMKRILAQLQRGILLEKFKSSSRLYLREYRLDLENMVVHYDGSEKTLRRIRPNIKISDIREVREGEKDFSKKLKRVNKSHIFAIVVGADHKVLYLLAESEEIRNRWVAGLKFVMEVDKLDKQNREYDRLKDSFALADKNKDGSLDFDEIRRLLKTMNADVKKKEAKRLFDTANVNKTTTGKFGRQTLDEKEFVKFYHMVTRREDLEELFARHTNGKKFMDVKDLLRFASVTQNRPDTTEDRCSQFIALYEPEPTYKSKKQLSIIGFRNLMLSQTMFLFNPDHTTVYHDMTRPMTDYFIASSHNTYLMEDQLKGPSSLEAYNRALVSGCRCVELDCWDGPDDEPIIYHGHTLTSKIKFKNVIETVKEYGFKASPYPVILSIENHCSVEQQEVMAKHIKDILGDLLYSQVTADEQKLLPSPEDLKGRIILKGKRLPPLVEQTSDDDEVSDEDEAAEMEGVQVKEAKKKLKLSREWDSTITMKGMHFKDFETIFNNDALMASTSFGESKAEKFAKHQPSECVRMTHKQFVRTYPGGSRTDSSNYNPAPMWNVGFQIVALNYQYEGEYMQLNLGKFLDNGKSGYLLKPAFLLPGPNAPRPSANRKKLTIKVISGYQLPKPKNSTKGEIIDPYVKILVHGYEDDDQEQRTATIKNNGFNPRWDETFEFDVSVPDVCLVRFCVKDYDRTSDDFIGYYSLPFNSLQTGFRQFPLCDKYGDQMPRPLIFVHVAIVPM